MSQWTPVALKGALRKIGLPAPYRLLALALGASLFFHLIATVGTSGWSSVRQGSQTPQFDAYLTPLTSAVSVAHEAAEASSSTSAAPGVQTSVRKRAKSRVTPRSEAKFSAPENAIAVDGSTSDTDKDSLDAAGELSANPGVDRVAGTGPAASPNFPDAIPLPTSTAVPLVNLSPPDVEPAPVADLPSRVSISYNASTSIADGVAHYTWKRDGANYTFESTIQASGFFVNMFAGTITQQSSGTVTSAGISPRWFSIRRGEKPPETAEYGVPKGKVRLSRGSETSELEMPPKLQDTQSFLFQLAIEAPKLKTAEDRIEIWVTNARGLNRYVFRKLGEITIETRLGSIETVHLIRETAEVRDGYEAWLSPEHYYLPVKLKFYLDRFPAELIATTLTSTP